MRPEQGRDGGGGGGEKVVEESEDTVALSATEFFFSLDFGGFDVVLAALGGSVERASCASHDSISGADSNVTDVVPLLFTSNGEFCEQETH